MQQQQEQARLDTMAAAGLEGGLARSPQPAVYATSEQDTVASLLPGGQTVFSPSSAALYWDWLGADETVAQPDLGAAYVKSFSSDGAGGFHVTYVIDGTEYPVHFTRDRIQIPVRIKTTKSFWRTRRLFSGPGLVRSRRTTMTIPMVPLSAATMTSMVGHLWEEVGNFAGLLPLACEPCPKICPRAVPPLKGT